jgi:hypothetical protein
LIVWDFEEIELGPAVNGIEQQLSVPNNALVFLQGAFRQSMGRQEAENARVGRPELAM